MTDDDDFNRLKQQLFAETEQRIRAQNDLHECKEQLSLVGSILHDINNLLLVIHFSTKELFDQFNEDDPMRSSVVTIQDARQQATELTRQYERLDYASSRNDFVCDLNELIKRSERVIEKVVRANVIVTMNLVQGQAIVNADPDVVDRIILRLVLNAISAVSNGGWVTIATDFHERATTMRDSITIPRSERFFRLTISDTGGATDLEMESNALDKRYDDAQRESIIALIDKMVRRFGGWIKLQSFAETGTKIEIYFPAARETTIPHGSPNHQAHRATGAQTILLVEDEEVIRKFLKRSLESKGYQVIDVPDGISAMAIAREQTGPIDLLLTDLMLPGGSGQRIAETLQAIYPELPVIIMSGFVSDEADVERVFSDRTAFLQKPFQTAELFAKMQGLFDRQIRSK